MRFVLDFSVSMRWLLRSADTDEQKYADQVLASLIKDEAWVPRLWWAEMAKMISGAEQQGLLSQVESEQFLQLLMPLPIVERLMPSPQVFRETLALTRQYGLHADRAGYIALALQEGVPLATTNENSRKAAHQCGIPVWSESPELVVM